MMRNIFIAEHETIETPAFRRSARRLKETSGSEAGEGAKAEGEPEERETVQTMTAAAAMRKMPALTGCKPDFPE